MIADYFPPLGISFLAVGILANIASIPFRRLMKVAGSGVGAKINTSVIPVVSVLVMAIMLLVGGISGPSTLVLSLFTFLIWIATDFAIERIPGPLDFAHQNDRRFGLAIFWLVLIFTLASIAIAAAGSVLVIRFGLPYPSMLGSSLVSIGAIWCFAWFGFRKSLASERTVT